MSLHNQAYRRKNARKMENNCSASGRGQTCFKDILPQGFNKEESHDQHCHINTSVYNGFSIRPSTEIGTAVKKKSRCDENQGADDGLSPVLLIHNPIQHGY